MKAAPGFSDRRYCGYCRKSRLTRFATDGSGRLADLTPACPCGGRNRQPKKEWAKNVDRERRRAAICQHCDQPVVGKPKVALFCEAHRKASIAAAQKRHLEKVGTKHQDAYKQRHYERMRAKWRKYHAEHWQEKADYKREWRRKNRDKVKAQKRRHALRGLSAEGARRHKAKVRAGVVKPKSTRRNAQGERLCLAPWCRQVMHGRAKLCGRHKAAPLATSKIAVA